MIPLSEKEKLEYFHSSYVKVDGLWFVKTEEASGFENALKLDEQVWNIMPKIQARFLKKISGLDKGLEGLLECLSTKLVLEDYIFETEEQDDANGFTISIKECPWHKLMVKSGREQLSGKIGPKICGAEYGVWAREFGDDIRFELKDSLCKGGGVCLLEFSLSP